MTQSSSTWNLAQFIETLGFFGEVPFLGNIRWLQALFGQTAMLPQLSTPSYSAIAVVLVIGGLSPTGQAVIKGLRHNGLRVRAVVPHLPNGRAILGDGPELVVGDLQDPGSLSDYDQQQILQTVGAIVYCGGEAIAPIEQFQAQWAEPLEASAAIAAAIFDFTQPNADVSDIWGALDDVVMGGVSASGLRQQGQLASFNGQVSTANSGGFTSIRTRNLEPPLDFNSWTGIQLTVRGDGQRYKFILRDNGGWDAPAYCCSFDTQADTWQTLQLPFEAFIPTFRAKTLPDAPPVQPDHIYSLQVMLSKFEYDRQLNPSFSPGPFKLDMQTIGVYRHSKGLPWVTAKPTPSSEAPQTEAAAALEADRCVQQVIDQFKETP